LDQQSASFTPDGVSDYPPHSFWKETEPSNAADDLRRKRLWRVSLGGIEALRKTVKKYEGTHNFHNFTVGRDFSDRSNHRYMKKIEVFPYSKW